MGRSPDYKAAFLGTLGANADFYRPFPENARRRYRESTIRFPSTVEHTNNCAPTVEETGNKA
jgi:hypothetical protein